MSPYVKTRFAEMQRVSLASDIRDAYDNVDALLANAREINSAHLVNLSSTELHDIWAHLSEAKEQLFLARVLAEKGQP